MSGRSRRPSGYRDRGPVTVSAALSRSSSPPRPPRSFWRPARKRTSRFSPEKSPIPAALPWPLRVTWANRTTLPVWSQSRGEVQRIDIVVNNAATCPTYGPFIETTPEVWDKIMDVNLRGPFLLSRIAAAEMKERRQGRIINISSNEGLDPNPNLGAYSISKAALISMTKVLARDLGQHGIQVNCIAPGLIKTRFSQPLFSDPEKYEHYMKRI